MQHLRRPRSRETDIWPGFVDALSALLMVVIFVLMVFTVGQFALSVQLSGRDEEVVSLQDEVADLTALLSLERRDTDDLRSRLSGLSEEIRVLLGTRDRLQDELDVARSENAALTNTITLQTEEIARLVEAQVTLDEDLDTILSVAEGDQAALERQMAEIARLEDDIAALATVRNALELEVAALELAAVEAAARIADLLAANDGLETRLTQSEETRSGLERDLTASLQRATILRQQLDETLSALSDSRNDLAQTEDRLAATEARRAQERQISADEIASLMAQLRDRLSALEAAEQSNLGLADALAESEERIAALARDLEASEATADDLAILGSDTRRMLETTETTLSELRAELAAAARALEDDPLSVSRELRITQEDLLRILDSVGISRDENRNLESRLADQEAATVLAQEELSDARRDLFDLNVEIETLRARLGTVTADREDIDEIAADRLEQIAVLNEQVRLLRDELLTVQSALDASEATVSSMDVEIAALNRRINQAALRRLEDLSRAQSDFFGAMRDVLADRDDVTIVGDRFIFSSEVLFAAGQATLQAEGQEQLSAFATTLLEIAQRFPDDVDWILRVDGHTDSTPISTAAFSSNWELSTARATSVVRYLISRGLPPNRLAAAGFGEYQPIDQGDSLEALARNRRIELKLDQRVASGN